MSAARYAIRAGRRLGLNATPGMVGLEAATQTFVKGAVLIDNGSGYLAEGGANPTGILGIADEDAHNDGAAGTSKIAFTPAIPNVLFEASLDQASALGTYVSLQTDLWAEYGITEDASGIWYVDVDKTGATGRFRIVEFIDAVGSTFTRVLGFFVIDNTAFGVS